ncbi:MAG TPA: sulfatase-like hydrolase/transferase [Candidatus Aminicenantes bacterium]|nr:sulfatase-like hydrolase/transferase [Candidatus Aminicenantes bacterium]HRY64636.1 sulfatase-like hydrolase/transferase [Candidatus Aminicenantes bacterium]HRZ71549.1 sulfatase-like hydrolase/transferase [Candidatus Aminicenantes bacterium]
MRRTSAAALLAALALAAACSTAKGPADAKGLNLLVITLDTTRADAVGLYGNPRGVTPRIDELGRTGIVFENCYTPVPLTLPAHCSLFTGRTPLGHQVRNNGTYVLPASETTLAAVFRERGYDTAAFVASFTLSAKFGLARGFDAYDEDFETGQPIVNYTAEIPADRVYAKFARWLDGRAGRRFFAWVHFYDPHAPYLPHPDGSPGDGSAWSLYEGEVRYVDAHVGRIVQALKDKGLYESTVLVLVGDHGEAFGEHKEHGHGIFCYEESLRVPLVLHNPRLFQPPRTVAGRVSLIDVMPGLLELFRAPVPDAVQGRSFWPLVEGRESGRREIYFESLYGPEEFHWAPLTGLLDGPHKYISLPQPELYDIDADPGEKDNLAPGRLETARAIDGKLAAFVRTAAAAAGPSRRGLSASDVKALTSLGYVSSFGAGSGDRTDPKTGIVLYADVMGLKDLVAAKDYEAAGKRLAELESRNPGVELADLEDARYQLLKARGRADEALAVLRRAVERFPERESFKVRLGVDLIESGRTAEAGDYCRRFAAESPEAAAAHVLLGDAEDLLGRPDEALSSYERAAALEPRNPALRSKIAAVWIEKGDLAKAQAILAGLESSQAVVDSTDFQEAMSGLGHAFLAAGRTDEGLGVFRKATVLSPRSPAVWLNLGGACFALGDYAAALENFEKSVALDPGFALGWSNIGQVHLAGLVAGNGPGEAEAALANFEKAIGLEPRLAVAWNGRASVRLAQGRPAEAVRDYEQALRLDPGLLDAYINVSIALRELGRNAEARRYLETCRDRLGPRLSPADRDEIGRLIAELT